MARTLIKGGTVITVDPALGDLPTGHVRIEDTPIVDVGPDLDSRIGFGMTPLNNSVGAFVYNANPGLVDTILADGRVVKRNGKLLGVDYARVRRLAIESRDDIIRRADGENGARGGGDWIPKAYEAVAAEA